MIRMLRTATAKVFHPEHAPVVRESATRTFTLHRDGQPFMVINGTFEHAQFIVAGFSRDHTWMLLAD